MSTIPNTIEEARPLIEQLVERFGANIEAYRNPAYNETQTRREFIDPFFKALGWDVDNEQGFAEAYKDVIHEDAIRVGGATKAPDYCFRIGGQRKFFVEAKKPSVDMKNDPDPYYQLRRYAYSAKLPLSIVTDFEELAVVDCRAKPSPGDKASTGRIHYYTFRQYLDELDEIYSTFSKQAVLTGSYDRFATTSKGKRGSGEVDKEFLKEIEAWRDLLARNIALRNPGLTQRELNTAVQLTIDRIIFLRICEDRGIEDYGVLQGAQNGANVYARLCEQFQRADERYNSGLFHFREERGNPSHPDAMTLGLAIDDKPLKQILKGLYYPDSPYEFSVLPADILGQVYEQFLGKVIRLTAGHQAKVEDKPEVKKAGGVYYTPTYIVEYIVKNTVGKLLQGSTPTKAAKLRILDPACGSGSFLIGAYDCLMDWHRDWYTDNDPEKWAKGKEPKLFQGKDGWQLTTSEKKRILLNNIYGVDIDSQAVEVTKLSLLLKVLEEENQESMNAQLKFFHERALPDLSRNIKCGNSLIGSDFYEGQQMGLLDEDEIQRINPFDWEDEFTEIMKGGGFDAVIGNPPYVRSQSLGAPQREYYGYTYQTATGTYDIYVMFVECAITKMKSSGCGGFILPNKFFTTDYGEGMRKLLGSNNYVERLVDFEDAQIFEKAGTYTTLLFLNKSGDQETEYARLGSVYKNIGTDGLEKALSTSELPFDQLSLTDDGSRWTLAAGPSGDLLVRLKETHPEFASLAPHIFQGLKTSADKVYMLKIERIESNLFHCINGFSESCVVEKDILRPVVKGEHVKRYLIEKPISLFILYPYRLSADKQVSLIDQEEMKQRFPGAFEYLKKYEEILGARDRGKWANRSDWYAYARSQNIGTFVGAKFLVPYMTKRLRVAFDMSGEVFFVNITTGGYGLRILTGLQNMNYISALLNSRLLDFCIKQMTNKFRGGYFAVNKQALERLPIRIINFSDPTEKSRHDQIVELVERMLNLNKQLQIAKTSHDKTTIERQISATDGQIDRLVYELYDLTEEEIKIVEATS